HVGWIAALRALDASLSALRMGREAGRELSPAHGLSIAHGGGNGICLTRGRHDQPFIWRHGGAACEIWVGRGEFGRLHTPGGLLEAERFWLVRRARQCLVSVPGRLPQISTGRTGGSF